MTSFPKYDRYKDSGVEWLGEIPEHWDVSKTRWLWDEIDDRSENGDEQLLSISQYTGVTPTTADSRSESLEGYRRCKPDDLAMNIMLAWQGGLGVSDYEGIISPAYSVFRLKSDNNAHYLGYLYRTKRYLDEFGRNSTGIVPSRWRLYPDKFGHILTLLPPKPEQDRIVTFLNRKTAEIDALIAKKQRQIELLDEQKAILINRAVTRGLNPNAKLKPSGIEWIGDIPEEWHLTRLKHVANRIGDGLHGTPTYDDSSDIFFINGNNLQSGSIAVSESTRTVSEKVLRNHFSDFGSSTIFISINGTLGNAAIYGGEKIMLGKSAAYIKCTEAIEPQFAYFVTTTIPYVRYYHREASGTTIHNLSLATLRGLPIPLPPLPEQSDILEHCGQIVRDHSKATASAARQIENLREYLSTLIAHAVTGRIKI